MRKVIFIALSLLSVVDYGQGIKISALPQAGSLSGSELTPIVQNGITKKTTVQSIANLTISDSLPYYKYVALLTQTDTFPPVATVLENNIGNITWTRTATGHYYGNLTGAFISNKTFVVMGIPSNANNNTIINRSSIDTDKIDFWTLDIGGLSADDALLETGIEIRVYK